MARVEKARKRPRPRVGLLVLLALLLGVVAWQLRGLREKVAAAQDQRDALAAQVEALRAENDRLSADIEEGTTPEKIEQIARDELGMLSPGEYLVPDGID